MNSDSSPRRGPTWPSPDPGITRRNSRVSCVGVSGSKSRPPPRNSVCLGSEARGSETQDRNGVSLPGLHVVSRWLGWSRGPEVLC